MFPLVYFRFISNQNIFYGRYLLPLLPFLSLLAAAAVVVARRLDAAHAASGAPLRNAGDHRADADRRSRRRPIRRSRSTPTPPRTGRRSRRTTGFAGSCRPAPASVSKDRWRSSCPAPYKTSYVEAAAPATASSPTRAAASSTSSPPRSATGRIFENARSSIPPSTPTTSGSSPRRRRSRASRRRPTSGPGAASS